MIWIPWRLCFSPPLLLALAIRALIYEHTGRCCDSKARAWTWEIFFFVTTTHTTQIHIHTISKLWNWNSIKFRQDWNFCHISWNMTHDSRYVVLQKEIKTKAIWNSFRRNLVKSDLLFLFRTTKVSFFWHYPHFFLGMCVFSLFSYKGEKSLLILFYERYKEFRVYTPELHNQR